MQQWAQHGRVNAFNVRYLQQPYMDGDDGLPTQKQLDQWLKQTARCLAAAESVGLRDAAYFYMFDEAGKDAIPAMEAVSQALHARFPDLLQLTTAYGDDRHGLTKKLPHLDGWCPRIPGYDFQKARKARRKYGREVWWYTANTPRPPYPNFQGTQKAITHRVLMGFMAHAYQTDGFLYWRAEKYWPQEKSDIDDGPYIRDGWPLRQHGQFIPRGPHGPLPSIRLEMFRDGLEDYEYLQIAKQQMKALAGQDRPAALRRLQASLQQYDTPGNKLVQNFKQYVKSPRNLQGVRQQLAQFIEQARDFIDR
jgi:hypothetical protein